jgi:hypothetical protein
MRTMTLLFFAVVSFLLGGLASVPAQTMMGIGRQGTDPYSVAWGLYGAGLTVLALAAPALFFVAALVAAFRRE